MTQDEVLQEHAEIKDGVLLSSSLWEGVDLKDDLSRFQIIAKVPYPNLSEKRTKIKMQKFPLWYKSQTLMKLLQGFGRSIRSEEDWAVTYVLDAAARDLLNQSKAMIPKSYYDVLDLKIL
jgi:Rad3-related DNA helicase